MWQRTKHNSKVGFDKLWGWADKLGAPVNNLSNKLGSEAFWPTSLDKECDKAARILRSFCKDGFYEEHAGASADGPKQKQKVLKSIPTEVIRNAKGLAIFTTMRTGLWVSGAGGSGIIIGRTEDGTWSPPSGILLHTGGLGFLVGVDIYDCVVVINTEAALEAFTKVRCTVGGEVSAVAGPMGVGGILETEVHKRQAPVFTYLKSRGFYAGVQVDGTVVIERTDENERFYGEKIGCADILAGKVAHPPYETKALLETIRAAEGGDDIDNSLVPSEPPPGDYEMESEPADPNGHVFGIPDMEDPDPFGVLALEKQGLHIIEAGTKRRPDSTVFEFHPSPASPIFSAFSRRSVDSKSFRDSRSASRRSSWRTSTLSTMDRSIQTCTTDMATQTDFDSPAVSISSPRPSESPNRAAMAEIPEDEEIKISEPAQAVVAENITAEPEEESEVESEDEDMTDGLKPEEEKREVPEGHALVRQGSVLPYGEEDAVLEEPVVHQVQAPQAIRARLVTVTKPTAPKLPPRNPGRNRKGPLVINADPLNSDFMPKEQATSSSPRTPQSLSEKPSVRTDSASSISSRDSVSSVEAMEAMTQRVSKISMVSGDEKKKLQSDSESAIESDFESDDEEDEKKVEEKNDEVSTKQLHARRESDEFHTVPATPEDRAASPLKKVPSQEDFS
ncbi:uncharacterized protein K452DRAFT_300007 [Aplosporella prunicola CBS 121167]|uniref:Ysc84 actin-binding domain-containing protein n=1 Tax=Aplosporella prunicola CBS 121167 TaxID=1176127 RepID=A0A6A6BAW9_9PEZI|nr:uncharacterized protein K452DRAFT_300007 [Aplosporella prunicola CBS 121167]KAF2140057.1 hypothetical protein K452DRAFT_300007 [Aplosporella prunicola CBS 121167]